jgi:hypothetical protein
MPSKEANLSESLVSYSHRSLWVALALVLALGATAVSLAIFPGAKMAGNVAALLPLAIVFAAVGLRSRGGKLASQHPAAMRAIQDDELRQQSLSRAYRNGLLAVLVVQPLLAFALASFAASYPLAVMAAVTVTTGAAMVLASLLAYDR